VQIQYQIEAGAANIQIIMTNHTCIYKLLQIIHVFTIIINIMGGVLICIISQHDVAYMHLWQRWWGEGSRERKRGRMRESESERARESERETGMGG
jgi:hypothetical protein